MCPIQNHAHMSMSSFRPVFLFLVAAGTLSSCQVQPPLEALSFSEMIVLEPAPLRTANAEVADFDGDGFNDVALAIGRHWPGKNVLMFGDGQGGFSRVDTLWSPGDRTYSLSAADMDDDGDLDLVVSNDRPDINYVLLNDGSGGFRERIDFGEADWPTRNSTVADLNGDGRPDIVVANRSGDPRAEDSDTPEEDGLRGDNHVCLNDGFSPPGFTCEPVPSGSATTITVADIDGDGFQDLIVPYRDGGQSRIYAGDGTGLFARMADFGPSDASFRAADAIDINSDGTLDLVAIDDAKRTTTVFLQLAGGGFDTGYRLDDGDMIPYALDHADLDGDGREDVVVGYRDAPTRLFINRLDAMGQMVIGDSSGAAYGYGIGDVNHDGLLDIVAARSDASDVLFLGRQVR